MTLSAPILVNTVFTVLQMGTILILSFSILGEQDKTWLDSVMSS